MPAEGWRLWSPTPEMRVQLPSTRPSRFAVRHPVARQAPNTHMINRIQHLLDERAESPLNGDYFVVAGEFGQVFVARETACRLRTLLTRTFSPRWIGFRTITGSLTFVRARHVNTIIECTAEQRATARQFWRAREAEENADRRPWDPD
jgi:hypothetical protein